MWTNNELKIRKIEFIEGGKIKKKKGRTFFKSLPRAEGEEDEEGRGDSGGRIGSSSLGSTPSVVAQIRKIDLLWRSP